MMFLVACVVLIGLLTGLTLLVLGWRGRKIDDHPWCVACRFDLFDLPKSTRTCPECGAEIQRPSAVRVGQRRRRSGFVVTGVFLTLLCALPPPVGSDRELSGSVHKILIAKAG